MSYNDDYWNRIAAALSTEEKNWLMKSRRRRLAGGRKLTNAEIGAMIGKSGHWVSRVALILGSKSRFPRRAPNVVFAEDDVARFTQLWSEGVPCAEIGKHWGCRKDWASKHAQKLGLPKRNNTVTNKQVAEIKRRLEAGATRREVMEATGLSYGSVAHYARVLKMPRNKPRGKPPRIDGGLADRMARRGMKQREIAAHFGVCRAAVGKSIQVYRKRLDERAEKKPTRLIPPVRPAEIERIAA